MTNLILVVDDDYMTRIQLCDLLEQAGYQVAEASNGSEALDIYSEIKPNLVLLDAMMPIMDGFTCCVQLQTVSGSENTPVLMITGLYDQASVERAFAVGATDLITKPIYWPLLRERVSRMLQASRAVKELRQQTQQAQMQETQLRLALEASQMGVWNWDITNNKVTWSDEKEVLFGLKKGSFDGSYQAFINYVHPQDRDFVNRSINNAVEEGAEYDIEFRVLLANNSIRWLLSKGVVFRDASGVAVGMCGVDMDITKRKQAQEKLTWENRRSQLFADITLKIRQSLQLDEILHTTVTEVQKLLYADRVLILQLQSNGCFSTVKEAVVPGLPVVEGTQILDPCFLERYIEKYSQGHISAITDIAQANIEQCYLEILQKFGVKANLVVPITCKHELWGLLIAHHCQQPRRWTDWEIGLLRELADQIGIAVVHSLILAQETRQREELSRSNEELQQFAFIASHDLQEPLRKILSFGERLQATCEGGLTAQGLDYLERMQNAAIRMQTLIEDLLTLSRVTTRAQPFISVNLTQIIQGVLSDLEVRIQQTGGRVEVEKLPIIQADPVQMRQLFQNLIGNALKFHRPNIRPIVKIYSQHSYNQSNKFSINSEFCEIIVEDNGIGIEEKYLDRIFNVFQRLHGRREYEGTGIGLAICKKIAERHHGSIIVQSKPGVGAKFIVKLPINTHL